MAHPIGEQLGSTSGPPPWESRRSGAELMRRELVRFQRAKREQRDAVRRAGEVDA